MAGTAVLRLLSRWSRLFMPFTGLVVVSAAEPAAPTPVYGLPLLRHYTFDEIGDISAGARLNFDALGRLLLFQEGSFLVFNDRHWRHVLSTDDGTGNIAQVAQGPDGRTYFGAGGSWGWIDYQPDGSIIPVSVRPKDCPSWVSSTTFDWVVPVGDVIVFGGWGGVVRYHPKTGENQFMASQSVATVFAIGPQVFVSSYRHGLCRLEGDTGMLVPMRETVTRDMVFQSVTRWDDRRVLVATQERKLVLFDGETCEPWTTDIEDLLTARVAALLRLDEDRVAVALRSRGLFILDNSGRTVLVPEGSQFGGVADLRLAERGVLWVSTTEGITKLFYRAPVSFFDHRLGMTIGWPEIFNHRGVTHILTDGHVYVPQAGRPGAASRFEPLGLSERNDVVSAASAGDGLLFGTNQGLFFHDDATGTNELVMTGFLPSRVVRIDPGTETYLALGATMMTALRRIDGSWREVTARVPGFGFPAVLHQAVPNSLWVELGVNRVGRITLRDGALQTRVFTEFPNQ